MLEAMAQALVAGDRSSLARAMTLMERGAVDASMMLRYLPNPAQAPTVVGITGPAGSGKSTLVSRLVSVARLHRQRVAVLAIDPSSPFSGGAFLGDRIRMDSHWLDTGVFIRSVASRGAVGGLSEPVALLVHLLSAAGYDPIFIETVGVGQTEIDVMRVAGTTVVVLAPGFGDDIQLAKAGLMEIAGAFVVNKGDLPGAAALAREVKTAIRMAGRADWRPPVISVSALQGSGIEELWSELQHRATSGPSNGIKHARGLLRTLVQRQLEHRFEVSGKVDQLIKSVESGDVDLSEAVDLAVAAVLNTDDLAQRATGHPPAQHGSDRWN